MTKKLISIYKSPKKEGMYLYFEKSKGLDSIPESLIEIFGTPALVTHMMVNETKQFSKFTAEQLFHSLNEKGFYLQMPEPLPEYKKYLVKQNNKLN